MAPNLPHGIISALVLTNNGFIFPMMFSIQITVKENTTVPAICEKMLQNSVTYTWDLGKCHLFYTSWL